MKHFLLRALERALLPAAIAVSLSACGGGGSGGAPVAAPPPAPPATFALAGAVSGLADGAALIVSNGADSVTVTANGDFAFPTKLASGTAYKVTSTAPDGHVCSVVDGAGSVAAGGVGKVTVKCTVLLLAGKERLMGQAYAIASGPNGDYFILDNAEAVIWRINAAGSVNVFAGTRNVRGHDDGAAGTASFNPNSYSTMAFDPQGNLILADSCNGLLRKISPAGVASTLAGQLQPGCDENAMGNPPKPIKDGKGTDAVFWKPERIAIDSAGNMAVSSFTSPFLRRVSATGDVTTATLFPNSGNNYGGLAFDKAGRLFVANNADYQQQALYRVDGNQAVLVAGPSAIFSSLVYSADISALQIDSDGNFYLGTASVIRKITPAGVGTDLAGAQGKYGQLDGTGAQASFNYVSDMALKSDGKIAVLDWRTTQLREVTSSGVVTTPPGLATTLGYADGKGGAARFGYSDTLASAADGSVYTLDYDKHVVRKVAPDGTVSLFAGIPGTSGKAVGPKESATFWNPTALTTDASGAVYVVDRNGLHKIAGGVVTMVRADTRLASVAYVRVFADGGFAYTDRQSIFVFSANGDPKNGVTMSSVANALHIKYQDEQFMELGALEVDSAGNLYIAEKHSGVIVRRSPAGELSLFAGTPGVQRNVDGPPGAGAIGFESLGDMTIDSAGNLYLSGTGAVRKISPQGVLSTPALAWGRPHILGITARNGLLYGSIEGGIMQTPLP